MHWTPKGYKPWRQRPEVPSEKPKHKNNSMSKNKIPSSEVPGARPLPAAGTSPFPCSWRSQAGLTQSRSAAAILLPRPRPGTAQSGSKARPRAAAAGTASRERKRRADPQARPPNCSRSPRGRRLRPAQPDCAGCPRGPHFRPTLPAVPGPPERKCASLPGPPWPRGGSALPPPLPTTPRRSVRRVPDGSRVTWPHAGGGSGPGAGRPGRAGQSRGGALCRSWMAGAVRSASAAVAAAR